MLFQRQNPRSLQKSLRTYIPSLATQLVRPTDGGSRWGLQIAIPGGAPLELSVRAGYWFARTADGGFAAADSTGLQDAAGAQTMTVFVARQVGTAIAAVPGPVAENIRAECRGFLKAIADRQLPTSDYTAAMARDALTALG